MIFSNFKINYVTSIRLSNCQLAFVLGLLSYYLMPSNLLTSFQFRVDDGMYLKNNMCFLSRQFCSVELDARPHNV